RRGASAPPLIPSFRPSRKAWPHSSSRLAFRVCQKRTSWTLPVLDRGQSITRADAGTRRRLVLIEGMIGSGKSTTAERLAARLIESGATAHAFNEGADDNPVRTRSVDRLLGRQLAGAETYA